MSLSFLGGAKTDAITLIKTICSLLLFPRTIPAQKQAIVEHVQWMERQTDRLDVACRLETFPATRTTRITIDVTFGGEVVRTN